MPKIEPKQQQQPERVKLGPFDLLGKPDTIDEIAARVDAGATLIEVQDSAGDDAYHVRETAIGISYRTVQRIDLATRLQLPHDYDPAELVGRTFLVEA